LLSRMGFAKVHQSYCVPTDLYGDHCHCCSSDSDIRNSICGRPLVADTPRRRRGDAWTLRPVKVAFILLTLVFLGILILFSKTLYDVKHNSTRINGLVTENTHRIGDIQNSRLESCKRTYEGIGEVFQPFFPKAPRTRKQQAELDKFNKRIDQLQQACIDQITPPKIPKTRKNQ